jgi:hypothetical protein
VKRKEKDGIFGRSDGVFCFLILRRNLRSSRSFGLPAAFLINAKERGSKEAGKNAGSMQLGSLPRSG